jgi:hypothetical protein
MAIYGTEQQAGETMDRAMTQDDPAEATISSKADIQALRARIHPVLIAVVATFTGVLLAVSVATAATFSLSGVGSVYAHSASRQAISARHRSCIQEQHFSLAQRRVRSTRGRHMWARSVGL